jgi:Ca2+-binding RTX toxin-like protein
MAWIIPIADTDVDIDLTTVDSLYIGKDIYFAAHARGEGSKQRILVDGTVAAGDQSALALGDDGSTDNIIQISKTGTVVGLGYASSIIPVGAVVVQGKSGKVVNEGAITAPLNDAAGIIVTGSDEDAVLTVVNSGTIRAEAVGVLSGAAHGTFTLTNSGTIIGGDGDILDGTFPLPFYRGSFTAITLVEGALVDPIVADTIYNSGRMVGDIHMGAGADYYEGRNGTVEGEVFGGAGQDKLFAGAGNDRLFGEDGSDTLMGGAGADYLNGGAGTDTVLYTSAPTGVTASLANAAINTGEAAGDSYVSIENVTGSGFNDILVGNGAANILSGGVGNDRLTGLAGNDVLGGGAGNDIFVFAAPLNAATNVDRITDFSVADDTIHLENAYFTALTTTGVLAAGAFQSNSTGQASDASDRIIYETDTGNLFYDADGLGGAAGILFARLSLGLALTNADFVVI